MALRLPFAVPRSLTAVMLALAAQSALAAPDEALLGKASGYPVGSRSEWGAERYAVGQFTNVDKLFTVVPVANAGVPSPLPVRSRERAWRYQPRSGGVWSPDDYLARQRVTGLLVIKDGEIVFERYQYDRRADQLFTSQSMAKTITAMAVGIAIADGSIGAVEDPVEKYVPALGATAYAGTSIRSLLQMSSGTFDRRPGDGTAGGFVVRAAGPEIPRSARAGVEAVALATRRVRPADERFDYFNGDTFVLGLLVSAAARMSLADFVAERIWQPLGAEAAASWAIDNGGNVAAHALFNARLRDFGRLGAMMANDGAWNGRQIVPRDWVRRMTTADPERRHLAPGTATPYFGYGYQTWLFPGPKRRFAFLGIHGQAIFVDPELQLVMVQTAVWRNTSDPDGGPERDALWRGLVNGYGRW